MTRVLSYKVVLEPCEEGGYTVYVPSLPGCVSEGDTREQAIGGWIEASKECGDEIPPSDVIIESVQVAI